MATTPSSVGFLQAYRPRATAAPRVKAVSRRSRERPSPKLRSQVMCVSPLKTGGGSDRERLKVRTVDRKHAEQQKRERAKEKPHRRGLWGLRTALPVI